MSEAHLSSPASAPATIRSRLLSIFYDSLIVFFIIVIMIIVIQLIVGQGKEIPAEHIIHKILKSFWLFISFLYFGYFWTKRGQTPGMSVWKIKVVNKHNELISWSESLIRYITALFGLGLLLIPFNKPRQAIQDIMSKTTLIKV